LPRPIIIPDVMELATLADVRILVEKHLPKEYRCRRELQRWNYRNQSSIRSA
jgi:hypothetical protein